MNILPHIQSQRQMLLNNLHSWPLPYIYAQANALDILKQVEDLLGPAPVQEPKPAKPPAERKPCKGCSRKKTKE